MKKDDFKKAYALVETLILFVLFDLSILVGLAYGAANIYQNKELLQHINVPLFACFGIAWTLYFIARYIGLFFLDLQEVSTAFKDEYEFYLSDLKPKINIFCDAIEQAHPMQRQEIRRKFKAWLLENSDVFFSDEVDLIINRVGYLVSREDLTPPPEKETNLV